MISLNCVSFSFHLYLYENEVYGGIGEFIPSIVSAHLIYIMRKII